VSIDRSIKFQIINNRMMNMKNINTVVELQPLIDGRPWHYVGEKPDKIMAVR